LRAAAERVIVGRTTMPTKHADGTVCLEGTRSVPRSFAPCCEAFEGHLATCSFDVRYEWWSKARTWVIAIAESAGGGGITISYCPHCGSRLDERKAARASKRVLQRPALARRR
jgi:hypothetical protein